MPSAVRTARPTDSPVTASALPYSSKLLLVRNGVAGVSSGIGAGGGGGVGGGVGETGPLPLSDPPPHAAIIVKIPKTVTNCLAFENAISTPLELLTFFLHYSRQLLEPLPELSATFASVNCTAYEHESSKK